MVRVALYLPVLMALLLPALFLLGGRHRRSALLAGAVTLTSLAVGYGIAHLYYHPRPFLDHTVQLLIQHQADSSLPSRHATAAFGVALGLWPSYRRAGLALLLLALLAGVARVYVGVHWPSDILAAALIAGLASLAVHGLMKVARSAVMDPLPDGPAEVFFIEANDDLGSVIGRVQATTGVRVFYLVVPAGARGLRTPAELRLLNRACRDLGAEVVVVTEDMSLALAARSGGVRVVNSLQGLRVAWT